MSLFFFFFFLKTTKNSNFGDIKWSKFVKELNLTFHELRLLVFTNYADYLANPPLDREEIETTINLAFVYDDEFEQAEKKTLLEIVETIFKHQKEIEEKRKYLCKYFNG